MTESSGDATFWKHDEVERFVKLKNFTYCLICLLDGEGGDDEGDDEGEEVSYPLSKMMIMHWLILMSLTCSLVVISSLPIQIVPIHPSTLSSPFQRMDIS